MIYYRLCTPLVPDPVNETSTCLPYNDVVHNWHLNTYLVNNGWTLCYDEGFYGPTDLHDVHLSGCPAGDDVYIFMGAKSSTFSNYAYIGAYGPSAVISDYSSSTIVAAIPWYLEGTGYNVYWYSYYKQAYGFSSSEAISLTSSFGGDVEDRSGITSNERLSFSLNPSYGGYRAGSYIFQHNTNPFRQIIYYKRNCDTTIDAVIPMDGNCFMNDVVHHWNINSNLLNRGWTECYKAGYPEGTQNVTAQYLLNQCPIGDDVMVFVGALSTQLSSEAYLGYVCIDIIHS